MSNPRIEDNVLIYPFDRGLDAVIIVDSSDYDFSEYTELYADIKEEYNLPSEELLTLSLGNGLTVETVTVEAVDYSRLTISIDQDDTKHFGFNKYFLDVKGLKSVDDKIYLIMRVKLVKNETGTKMPIST